MRIPQQLEIQPFAGNGQVRSESVFAVNLSAEFFIPVMRSECDDDKQEAEDIANGVVTTFGAGAHVMVAGVRFEIVAFSDAKVAEVSDKTKDNLYFGVAIPIMVRLMVPQRDLEGDVSEAVRFFTDVIAMDDGDLLVMIPGLPAYHGYFVATEKDLTIQAE